jgi:death-on-curing protein
MTILSNSICYNTLRQTAMFLELNGYSLIASEPEAVVIIEEVAAGNMSEDDLSTG